MRPCRLTSLLTVLAFSFAVLAPAPLAAAESARASALASVKDFTVRDGQRTKDDVRSFGNFLKEDWARTKDDARSVGDFLRRDWARTKADARSVRTRLASLKVAASGGDRKGSVAGAVERVRALLADRLDETIDEMGPAEFAAAVQSYTGRPVVEATEGVDERLLKAQLARGFDEAFQTVADEIQHGDRSAVQECIKEAEAVVLAMEEGAPAEEVVETLKARHFGDADAKASGGRPGFMKSVMTVLKTLFFCAAIGAIGVFSMGFIAYGLTAGAFVFTATGGAAVAGCLYGVVWYVAQCVKTLSGKGAKASFLQPATAEGVLR